MPNSNALRAPVKPRPALANSEQIAAANKWRKRAIDAGYLTAAGALPKTIVEGETVRNVRARYERWKEFAENIGEQTLAEKPDKRGPRYDVPAYYPPRNCKSCSAKLAFVNSSAGKQVPIDTRGPNRGYSHFGVCPDAEQHRKPRAPKAAAVDGEAAYADAAPTRIGLPSHIKHLWAVAGANGLKAEPRDERIENSGVVLLDHGFDVVESWNDLDEKGARCLAGAIDANSLTWGEPNPELPLDGEAA